MDMGLVLVPQNLPVGAVVKTYRGSAGTGDVWYCGPSGGSITFENVVLWGDPVAGRSDVFSTNVPGIGYRLSLVDSGWTSTLFPGSRTIVIGPGSQAGRFAQWNWMFQLEIIKTADRVGNGPVSSVPVGRIQQGADATKRLVMAQIGDIRILAPSCQVAVGSRNQTVNLGQEFRNRFRGVGSTTASKDFQVVVNCQASPNGIENMVSLTMDATPDASSTPGVLGIDTGTGTASGVGIQVLDSAGQPVAFGQPKQLGQSKDGDYVVPFKARYYQVASAVGGGQANGRATVTLSYK
ncbi:fimbrial protein [Stenotrophomonas sp. CCNWLW162]|uniref:fimbrial protein n=1 Tax=Stenotrophomonas sp. CCNWLW162 TaxID=3127480 RepID=UPI003078457B